MRGLLAAHAAQQPAARTPCHWAARARGCPWDPQNWGCGFAGQWVCWPAVRACWQRRNKRCQAVGKCWPGAFCGGAAHACARPTLCQAGVAGAQRAEQLREIATNRPRFLGLVHGVEPSLLAGWLWDRGCAGVRSARGARGPRGRQPWVAPPAGPGAAPANGNAAPASRAAAQAHKCGAVPARHGVRCGGGGVETWAQKRRSGIAFETF